MSSTLATEIHGCRCVPTWIPRNGVSKLDFDPTCWAMVHVQHIKRIVRSPKP